MIPLPVCFDARMSQASGIGTYIRGLLQAIARRGVALSLLSSDQDGLPAQWPRILVSSRFYSIGEQFTIPLAFRRSHTRLLHVPHYNVPALGAADCVVTVHDLIHLKFPEFLPSRLAQLYATTFFRTLIPKARAILTVSEHTKRDLIDLLGIAPERITVTYPGVAEMFHPQSPAETNPILGKLGLTAGYFLYVGNLKEFKNVPRLLEAYGAFRGRQPKAPALVLVGRNFLPDLSERLKRYPGALWISDLKHASLPAVYTGALALVFPSLYEGFGLPPLEAMACGTPVITSDRASLPEVVGDAGTMLDPLDVTGLSYAMERLWQDPAQRAAQASKGLERSQQFHWSRTAQQTLSVYERCLA